MAYFGEQWAQLIGDGAKYQFDGVRDANAAARILDTINGDLGRGRRMVDAYLSDSDPWLKENGKTRGLSLLGTKARLGEYIAETANRPDAQGDHAKPQEHPIIAECRERWLADVESNLADYRDIADLVEQGYCRHAVSNNPTPRTARPLGPNASRRARRVQQVERIPPQDLEAEGAVLGGLLTASQFDAGLIDADLDEIRSILSPDAFYLSAHRKIYEAITATADAGGPADAVAIVGRLNAAEPGVDWDDELHQVGIQGDAANCSYYARMVRECWRKREIIRAAQRAVDAGFDPLTDFGDVLADLTKRLDQIEQRGLGDQEAQPEPELLRSIENPRHTSGDKVPVALGRLGYLLDGDLEPGSLTIVGARPSAGKTSLLQGLCVHSAKATDGCGSLFCSIEMSSQQIGLRSLSMRSGLSVHAIRGGQIEDDRFRTERGKAALEAESGFPIFVLDGITDAWQIVAHAKRFIRKHNVRLVAVDYIGLCTIPGRFDCHDLKTAALSALFKSLARNAGVAVVLASQLSRASDKEGRRPKLSDLRDSGALEQDADVVLLIHRGDDDSGPLADTTIICAKQRQGGCGDALLCYDKRTMSDQARHVGSEPWSVAGAEGSE